MALKQIRNKIRAVDKTRTVTKAMEAVSAVKMRKSQERALSGRPYATAALSILGRLAGSLNALKHPLVAQRDVRRACMVVITSDKGLAGSLNTAVLRATHRAMLQSAIPPHSYEFICIGKKAHEYFSKRGFSVRTYYENVRDDVTHEELETLSRDIAEGFTGDAFDECRIAYTNFVSTFEQSPVIRTILPLSVTELWETVRSILPRLGKYAEEKRTETTPSSYTIEPDNETVLNELLPFLLRVNVYHALLEAKASEHSARMVAMKNASDKAEEMSEELTRAFNKERQAVITREMSEIVGGIEAMTN